MLERASEQCCFPFTMPVCLLKNASVQEELSLSLYREMGEGCGKIPRVLWMGVPAVGNLTVKRYIEKLLLYASQPLEEQKVKGKRETFFT